MLPSCLKTFKAIHVSFSRTCRGVRGGRQSWCKDCHRKWRAANHERVKEHNCKAYAAHPGRYKKNSRKWRTINPGRVKELCQRWRVKNLERVRSSSRRRRAQKLQCRPPWANEAKINAIYAERDRLNSLNGQVFRVDHFWPLRHRDFSGLDVQWNLRVITATENGAKSNKRPDEFYSKREFKRATRQLNRQRYD
jgi:hypothetical protein